MTISITFVPAWAANVVSARGADFKDTLNALSPQDHKLFLLANLLFKTKLVSAGINLNEFTSIADDWNEPYTEAEALFALYGANNENRDIASWLLTKFDCYAYPEVGYTVVENSKGKLDCLKLNHIKQLHTLCGLQASLKSNCFKLLIEHHVASIPAV